MYGSRSRSTPTSLSRVTRRQQQQQQTQTQASKTSTRLQFSDYDASSSSNTAIESRWWKKLFMYSPSSPNGSSTTTTSTTNESEEQDNVDAYLEFLDRRYRRLHDDDKEEKEQQQQTTQAQSKQQESKIAKSFSAMDWLMNGNNNSNVVASTREQQEDALYVLGVAGLASVKLLQKHHLPTSTSTKTISPERTSNEVATATALGTTTTTIHACIEKVVELKEQIDDAIEVNEDASTSLKEMKNQIDYFLVNSLLLPVVRVIYMVQRQKQLFLQMIQQRVKALATRATIGVVQTFSKGPKSVLNSLLAVGGGRQNIFRTVAIGYATILVFQPLLHAAFAEGLAFDPLIQ